MVSLILRDTSLDSAARMFRAVFFPLVRDACDGSRAMRPQTPVLFLNRLRCRDPGLATVPFAGPLLAQQICVHDVHEALGCGFHADASGVDDSARASIQRLTAYQD